MLTIAGGILLAILVLFLIPIALGIVLLVVFTFFAVLKEILQSVALVWGLGPNEQKPITGRLHD